MTKPAVDVGPTPKAPPVQHGIGKKREAMTEETPKTARMDEGSLGPAPTLATAPTMPNMQDVPHDLSETAQSIITVVTAQVSAQLMGSMQAFMTQNKEDIKQALGGEMKQLREDLAKTYATKDDVATQIKTVKDDLVAMKEQISEITKAKGVDNADIRTMIREAMAESSSSKVRSASVPPAGRAIVKDKCAFSQEDVDAVKDKLELRVVGKMKTMKEAEEALDAILEQVMMDKDSVDASVYGTRLKKDKTRITVKFDGDESSVRENRKNVRWGIIERDGDRYIPKAKYGDVDVEVYCPKPRFEIERDNRLFDMGKIAATQLNLNFKDCKVNRELRIVLDPKGTIIAHQSKENWVACLGSC